MIEGRCFENHFQSKEKKCKLKHIKQGFNLYATITKRNSGRTLQKLPDCMLYKFITPDDKSIVFHLDITNLPLIIKQSN